MKYLLAIGLVLGLGGLATADEVKLRSGGTLKGAPREESGKVVIDTGFGTVTVAADEVVAILPDPLVPCQESVSDQDCVPAVAAPSAKPEEAKKNQARMQPNQDGAKKKQVQRARPRPEISPGYTSFGIPPSVRPRGSQNHGYGGIVFGLPTPVRSFFATP